MYAAPRRTGRCPDQCGRTHRRDNEGPKRIFVGTIIRTIGQQLLRLIGIALVYHAPLGFPDALNHNLLGSLGGDAAEFLNIHGDADGIAHLHVGIDVPGSVDLDFQRGILQLLHSGLDNVHGESVFAQIHHHIIRGHVPAILPVLAVSIGQRLLQPLHHVVHRNSLQFFQIPQACENLRANIDLRRFRLLFGSCISGHDLTSSYQNSTRRRTCATWDFSNVMVSVPASTVIRPSQ